MKVLSEEKQEGQHNVQREGVRRLFKEEGLGHEGLWIPNRGGFGVTFDSGASRE